MGTRLTQLQCKEVICLADGRRLGFISDVELDAEKGCVTAVIVPGACRLGARREDYCIPWDCIRRIGPDIVLVDIRPDSCRVVRPKKFFPNF